MTKQLPMEAWIVSLFKMAYDRELSISGQRVKPYDILHNSSLILGKHIVHILPEGYVSPRCSRSMYIC